MPTPEERKAKAESLVKCNSLAGRLAAASEAGMTRNEACTFAGYANTSSAYMASRRLGLKFRKPGEPS